MSSSPRSSMKSSISATWLHFSQHISSSGLALPSPAGLGLCSVAGDREKTHRPGRRSRNAPGNARARSPPGAPPEAATATTGRGGERAVSQPRWPGLLPHGCLSPDRPPRPAALTLSSCRRRRGRSGFLCLPRQVRGSPATEVPALLQPVAGVVSGSRDRNGKAGWSPGLRFPGGERSYCHTSHPRALGDPCASSPLPDLPAASLVRLGFSRSW